jgi:hypothetical protein
MTEALTERQRFWLEHVRRARESGQTLKAYARAQSISVSGLYAASSRFARPRDVRGVPAKARGPHSAFVAVRLAAGVASCRLRHPSGWVLELERLPEPDWLATLLARAGADASA